MLVLSIDESGRFENQINEEKEKILFVGGLLFKVDVKHQEENCIKNFLIRTVEKAEMELKRKYPNQILELKYPNSFHMGSVSLGENVPRVIINDFRNIVYSELTKFLSKNQYKIVCYLKDMHEEYSNGKQNCNVINDKKGGNLYERMVLQLVYNTIFYNLNEKNESEIVLNFATRKSAVSLEDLEANREMKKLGGQYRGEKNGQALYEFSNTLGYKSAIATKIRENEIKNCINFDLNSYSINYNEENKNPESLYLVDIICGYLRSKLDGNKQSYGIKSLMESVKKETGNYPIITIEDKEGINNLYNKLIIEIKNKDFIESLLYKYEIENSNSKFRDYYCEYLLNNVEGEILKLFNEKHFTSYLYKLELLLSKSNDGAKDKYNKAIYIVNYLWDIIENSKEKLKIDNAILYKISDCSIRALNHQGCLVKDVEKYRNKCEELKEYITIDEYIDTQNRLATTYTNSLMFDKALEVLKDPIDLIKELKEFKKDIASIVGCKSNMDIVGKLYSSIGQFYAFLNKNIESKEYFEKAFEEFGEDNYSSKKVTEGYYLHNCIYLGEKELFRERINKLTEGDKWLRKIEKCNDRYILFLLIKGIYKFFVDEIKLKDAKKMKEFIDSIEKRNSHPWELIYRNLGLVFYELREKENHDECIELFIQCMNEAIECVKSPDGTLLLIKYFNKFTKILKLQSDDNEKEKYKNKIKNIKIEFIKECLDKNEDFKSCFKDIENIEDENLESYLLSKLTYMYN